VVACAAGRDAALQRCALQEEVGAAHELETDLSSCKHENAQLQEKVVQQHTLLGELETRLAQLGGEEADKLALSALQSAQTKHSVERLAFERAAIERRLAQKTAELDTVQQRMQGMTEGCAELATEVDHLGNMLARKMAEASEWRARASYLERGVQAEKTARQADLERYKQKSVQEKWYTWRGHQRPEERMLSIAPTFKSESAAAHARCDEDDEGDEDDDDDDDDAEPRGASMFGLNPSIRTLGLPKPGTLPGRRERRDTGKPW
jgi:predicted nuclease with TOPRIM domain